MRADVGDIVTFSAGGRRHIGRVAAAMEFPAGTPPETVIVATPTGDARVRVADLRVIRPNFVAETWANLGYDGPMPPDWTR